MFLHSFPRILLVTKMCNVKEGRASCPQAFPLDCQATAEVFQIKFHLYNYTRSDVLVLFSNVTCTGLVDFH